MLQVNDLQQFMRTAITEATNESAAQKDIIQNVKLELSIDGDGQAGLMVTAFYTDNVADLIAELVTEDNPHHHQLANMPLLEFVFDTEGLYDVMQKLAGHCSVARILIAQSHTKEG